MQRLFSTAVVTPVLIAVLLVFAGCEDDYRPNVDLDKVLEVVSQTMQSPVPAGLNDEMPRDITNPSGQTGTSKVVELSEDEVSTELDVAFLNQLATELNNAELNDKPLGVRLADSGAIVGFTDENRDMVCNGNDKDIFQVEIDTAGSRMVATDMEDPTIHRDRSYSGHYRGGGFWIGYMMGSMSGRHERYYGSGSRMRPNYSSMQMAPKDYAKPGSDFRKSARSQGGSRSFSGGK